MTAQETKFIQILETILDKKLESFATKEDLKAFATKDYIDEKLKGFVTKEYLDEKLTRFATKEDLEQFATKDDLKSFSTKDDLNGLEARLSRKIMESRDINTQHHLETRATIGKLESEFGMVKDRLRPLSEI